MPPTFGIALVLRPGALAASDATRRSKADRVLDHALGEMEIRANSSKPSEKA
jgi:hypothetical protein